MGEWEFIHITNPEAVLSEIDQPTAGKLHHIHLERDPAYLRPRWNTLYKETLPALARSEDPVQPHWPVHLDHCFARIIYDAVIGLSRNPDSGISGPWTDRLEAPAVKNMHPKSLNECIQLGEDIATGKVDLVELDRLSLAVRGKQPKGGKRKRDDATQEDKKAKKTKTSPSDSRPSAQRQPDIRSAMGAPSSHASSSLPPPPAQIDPELCSKITLHPTLTPFRKRALLALCQVPKSQYTTYLAISNYLHSSPRAVGNALRNNPFAPRAPCHRVVAADRGIGGFGGEWGAQGKHNDEKVRLLREEGVAVGSDNSRVMGMVWESFA